VPLRSPPAQSRTVSTALPPLTLAGLPPGTTMVEDRTADGLALKGLAKAAD
jgi:hypothetical protein